MASSYDAVVIGSGPNGLAAAIVLAQRGRAVLLLEAEDLVLGRSILTPAEFERHNPNLVGGDISGGANNLSQLLARPTIRGYRTSARGLYLCSSSTPPGGGVHGMCGYFAAQAALADGF